MNSQQTNPYVPWAADPSGMLFAPLVLFSLVYGRRKKQAAKWEILLLVLLLGGLLALGLTACGGGPSATPTVQAPSVPVASSTPTVIGTPTATGTPNVNGTPNETPSTDCTLTYTPTNTATYTPTPTATPTPYRNGHYEWKKAVQFAREHKNLEYFKSDVGDGENPRPYAENNCANFTSYALYAGGLNITNTWNPNAVFNEDTRKHDFASTTWINVSALKEYLITTANFTESEHFVGNMGNFSYNPHDDQYNRPDRLPLRAYNMATNELQQFSELKGKEEYNYDYNYLWPEYLGIISDTRPGDLIIYKSDPKEGFENYHIAIITEPWQSPTEYLFSYSIYYKDIDVSYDAPDEPQLIDHSGPTNKLPRSIGDSCGSIWEVMILHQP